MKKLNFEHRKQKVISLPKFFLRLTIYGLFALLLITISLGIGVLGYHHFAQLSWLNSFHMSCMILTGMGPVTEMTTRSAKIFSSVYALYSGVAFLSITAVFFAPVIHRFLHILHADPKNEND